MENEIRSSVMLNLNLTYSCHRFLIFCDYSLEKYSVVVESLGEVNKGFQAIAATVTDYSKKAFEDGTRAFEQMIGAKSFEQAFEIQSQYAKKAFDAYIAQLSKLGEMYVDLARNAYKPVEQAAAKAGVPNRLRSA